jgi:hypothetical protein
MKNSILNLTLAIGLLTLGFTQTAFASEQTTTRTGPNGNSQTTTRSAVPGEQTTTRTGPNGNSQTTTRSAVPGEQTTTRTGPNGNSLTRSNLFHPS